MTMYINTNAGRPLRESVSKAIGQGIVGLLIVGGTLGTIYLKNKHVLNYGAGTNESSSMAESLDQKVGYRLINNDNIPDMILKDEHDKYFVMLSTKDGKFERCEILPKKTPANWIYSKNDNTCYNLDTGEHVSIDKLYEQLGDIKKSGKIAK